MSTTLMERLEIGHEICKNLHCVCYSVRGQIGFANWFPLFAQVNIGKSPQRLTAGGYYTR